MLDHGREDRFLRREKQHGPLVGDIGVCLILQKDVDHSPANMQARRIENESFNGKESAAAKANDAMRKSMPCGNPCHAERPGINQGCQSRKQLTCVQLQSQQIARCGHLSVGIQHLHLSHRGPSLSLSVQWWQQSAAALRPPAVHVHVTARKDSRISVHFGENPGRLARVHV